MRGSELGGVWPLRQGDFEISCDKNSQNPKIVQLYALVQDDGIVALLWAATEGRSSGGKDQGGSSRLACATCYCCRCGVCCCCSCFCYSSCCCCCRCDHRRRWCCFKGQIRWIMLCGVGPLQLWREAMFRGARLVATLGGVNLLATKLAPQQEMPTSKNWKRSFVSRDKHFENKTLFRAQRA